MDALRAFLAHHREGLLLIACVVSLGLAIVAWGEYRAAQYAADQRADDRQDAAELVDACLRGNEIRAYLALDNDERINRIETRLSSTVDPPAPEERGELRAELDRRLAQQERLVPFDCESLR